tara:strand:+ start:866 stop:1060 length:195 start_codon:yes stop_codon:yes gene_type:complete
MPLGLGRECRRSGGLGMKQLFYMLLLPPMLCAAVLALVVGVMVVWVAHLCGCDIKSLDANEHHL